MMKPVCHNCPDRAVGCHSTCEKYIQAKAEYEEQKAAKLADAMEHKDAEGLKRKSIEKIKRRAHRRYYMKGS